MLTSFFTFAFSLLFLALIRNYVQANNASLPPIRVTAVIRSGDLKNFQHHIAPNYA
jgi:hypothetical protein